MVVRFPEVVDGRGQEDAATEAIPIRPGSQAQRPELIEARRVNDHPGGGGDVEQMLRQ
jgi:hypothetical protein